MITSGKCSQEKQSTNMCINGLFIYKIFLMVDSGHIFGIRYGDLYFYKGILGDGGIKRIIDEEIKPTSKSEDLFIVHHDEIKKELVEEFFSNMESLYSSLYEIFTGKNNVKKEIINDE